MKTFTQFLTERENLYKISDEELEKKLGHDHHVAVHKDQISFLKKHLHHCPTAKENKSLIDTLNKSKDFSKAKNVIPPERK
jgi:hypothetical protein